MAAIAAMPGNPYRTTSTPSRCAWHPGAPAEDTCGSCRAAACRHCITFASAGVACVGCARVLARRGRRRRVAAAVAICCAYLLPLLGFSRDSPPVSWTSSPWGPWGAAQPRGCFIDEVEAVEAAAFELAIEGRDCNLCTLVSWNHCDPSPRTRTLAARACRVCRR